MDDGLQQTNRCNNSFLWVLWLTLLQPSLLLLKKMPTCLTRCAHSSYAGLIKLIPTGYTNIVSYLCACQVLIKIHTHTHKEPTRNRESQKRASSCPWFQSCPHKLLAWFQADHSRIRRCTKTWNHQLCLQEELHIFHASDIGHQDFWWKLWSKSCGHQPQGPCWVSVG